MEKQKMCFKRWTCKRYGIFASLKKDVRMGVISLGCSLLVMASQEGFAQTKTDSMQSIRLSEVAVTAQRQQVYSSLAGMVTVMGKEEIAKAPVQTLSDLLRYVSGVDIRQRGANGVQSDLSVRGGSFDQVLVLINGVNITDPQTGHYALDVPIDLSAIDRIEVLQGPGSRVLGPNAFSGAINIITGSSEKSGVGAQIVGGDHGYIYQGANATLRTGNVTTFATASNSRSNGYIDDTDFGITNAFGQVRVDSKTLGNVNIQGGYQDKAYGAYGFYSLKPAYANEYEHTRTFFASASTERSFGKLTIAPKVYWRRHNDEFDLFRDNVGAYVGYTPNYHQTDVTGAAVTASYVSGLGKTSLGLDYRYEHIYSNTLGEAMSTKVHVPFEADSVYFTKEKSRNNFNVSLDHAVYFDKFSASAGALCNYSNDFGSNFYFGGDLGYAFTSAWKAYASANQSLRLPTFTDLYYVAATQQGNPDLNPERAMTYELGLKYHQNRFNGGVSAYYRLGKNVIDWVKYTSSDVKYVAVNHAEVDALGGESFIEYLPKQFVQRVKLSYSYLHLDKQSDGYDSKYALDYLKHKVSLDIDHDLYKGFSASWRFNYSDRAGNYTDANNALVDYKPFFLTDLRLQWTNKKITIFGEATNLFNVKYADYGGVEQPGRWIKSGISVKL
ncbi:MAG: TonB-dependent receptor [Paludibacteraceae bacterium]|nr:TonB-dependent receptor [Paludibacteraceae bacterium]